MNIGWSDTAKTKLKAVKIDPNQIAPDELNALVDRLKANRGDQKAYPVRSLYSKNSKNPVFTEDGVVVFRSRAWVYTKLKPLFEAGQLDWIWEPWATTDEEDFKLKPTDIDVHLKAIVVGLQSDDLLWVPSPELNVGYGPGYLKVEAALSSLEEWSATSWAKWAGEHYPELPIWEMMKVVQKAMKGYSDTMRNVECLAIKGAQDLGFVWDRDDANADYRFSDDFWGVPLRWGVGIHFPQSCGRIVEKPIGQIEVESLGDGRTIFRLCWLYENSGVRPVAQATSLEPIEQAKSAFESAGDNWVEDEGVRYLIKTYRQASQSMDKLITAIQGISSNDIKGGRCPGCPLN